jgi:hypothetical protein
MIKGIGIKEIIAALTFIGGGVMFIYGQGMKNANKENDNTALVQSVDQLKTEVTSVKSTLVLQGESIRTLSTDITNYQTDTRNYIKKQDADFLTLEKSYVNTLNLINRVDEIVKYYENKAKNERDSKFPDTNMIITPAR